VIRAFDPNLTGKYDYDGRAELQKGLPVNFGGVELPKSLGSPLARVYSPENFHFEGYSQFPQPVSSPYVNEKLKISKDYVISKRSKDAMQAVRTFRDSFGSKWNQKMIEGTLENPLFRQNNVGLSNLTAPYNYSKQVEVKSIMRNEKDFIDRGIEKLQERYNKKTQFSKAPEGDNGDGEDEAAQVQTARGGRKSPTEIKIDKLKQTFSQNFAGVKKNGRL
jgi:hypothetical protein